MGTHSEKDEARSLIRRAEIDRNCCGAAKKALHEACINLMRLFDVFAHIQCDVFDGLQHINI
jgi:hypothetical protein